MRFIEPVKTLTANPKQPGYIEYEPQPFLKSYVRCFWEDTCSRSSSVIIPDLCVDILVYLDKENYVNDVRFSGVNDVHFKTERDSVYHAIFGVRFYAWSVWLFSMTDMSGSRNQVLEIDEVFPRLKEILQSECFREVTTAQRIQVVEHWLIDKLAQQNKLMSNDFLNAMDMLINANDPIRMKLLTMHTGVGMRQLERLFSMYTGMSPKAMFNIIRFQKMWHQLYFSRRLDVLDLAHQYGFTDQSHLTRHFRRYSGKTPSQLFY
ncbi:AraC family transcriptional regulator [Shouchella lonarensis]|uniref:Transcriptional regulator, AraC family n=1 Tax=Shouchella lonarensis TaxID=1464122 RepID=A0A1G6PB22_9BACI|nr:helix-turn-helix domain-containing protein [Shouchella lonarensis]SDC77279.1 transcriptional regulator, AraC family [Shouchella lonarensis]